MQLCVLPAWVSGEQRKWHPLPELLCDVICQGRSVGNVYIKPLNKIRKNNTIWTWGHMTHNLNVYQLFTLAGWCLDQGLQGQEQTQSDYCGFRMNMFESSMLKRKQWRMCGMSKILPAQNAGICAYGISKDLQGLWKQRNEEIVKFCLFISMFDSDIKQPTGCYEWYHTVRWMW